MTVSENLETNNSDRTSRFPPTKGCSFEGYDTYSLVDKTARQFN